jgi:hypothetical protein
MLRRFLYLDETALAQYVSALDGGAIAQSTRQSTRGGKAEGGVDAKVAKLSGGRTREDAESLTLNDTDAARFDRLLRAANDDPDALGWVEVVNPDDDLADIGIGAIVAWECELFVPDIVKMFSKAGEALPLIELMQTMAPAAETLGLNVDGIPDSGQLGAMASLVRGINSDALIVGEDDGTDWQVAGSLSGNVELSDLEGRARVVGKVARVLKPGQWKPFSTLPGMSLQSREDRRRAERTPPKPGEEDNYLHGPALVLDILAVYR